MQFQLVDSGGNIVANSAVLPVQPEGGSARRRGLLQRGPFRSTATFSPRGLPAGSFRIVVTFTPQGAFKPSSTSLNGAPSIQVNAGARVASVQCVAAFVL